MCVPDRRIESSRQLTAAGLRSAGARWQHRLLFLVFRMLGSGFSVPLAEVDDRGM